MSDLINNFALDFEKPVFELENQIEELKKASAKPGINIDREVKTLQGKVDVLLKGIYSNLTPWERVRLSRHPARPHAIDYINNVIEDFHELSGDRKFANDTAVIAGLGYLKGERVAVVGIEKGRKTKEKVIHNFGMPRPEGYRKALRIMKLASQFDIPIISFVDTPGAYPGIGAEERGQSCAIAENLAEMFDIRSPIVSLVIGEGGSGGALGIAIANSVLMMEYSIYSVISPESCASILWADPKHAETAANSLQLGPLKAKELNVIDEIVSEPVGGAHRDPKKTFEIVSDFLKKELKKYKKMSAEEILEHRYQKFRVMGNHTINTDLKGL